MNCREQYANGAVAYLTRMTSYTPDIVAAARAVLPHIFRKGYGYKTIMVTLIELRPAAYQGHLWIDPMEEEKKRRLMDSLDQITRQYGRGALTLAKASETSGWEMKREFLSPCWTTKYSDFPKIH